VASPEFVRVAPELGLDRLFDYRIPDALQGRVRLGQRLRVPWGRREILAYAVEFPRRPEVEKVRDVTEVAGERPLIPTGLCQLARWMADYYACDLAATMRVIWRRRCGRSCRVRSAPMRVAGKWLGGSGRWPGRRIWR